jgi:N-acetylmuramoyl-L-alanine amidase
MLPALLSLVIALPATASARSTESVIAQRLDVTLARLQKLESDSQRRKYREGWEALLRELDGLARVASRTPKAAEIAWTAAQVRVGLFTASRREGDGRAALLALRRVDEEFPGPFGRKALHAAVQLSWRTKGAGDRAAAARRLVERYPDSPEAQAVAARTAELSGEPRRPDPAALDAAVAHALAAAAKEPQEARPAEEDAQEKSVRNELPRTKTLEQDRSRAASEEERQNRPGLRADEAPRSVEGASSDERRGLEPQRSGAATAADRVSRAAPERVAPPPAVRAPSASSVALRGSSASPPAVRVAPAREDDADEDDDDSGPPEPEAVEAPPSKTGPILRAVKDAVAALTTPDDAPATAAKARELRSAALGSGSLSSQLGLKTRRIVIDAGHGGKDTGAIGPHGVREKDMALAIARKVAAKLKSFGFSVLMTRRDDTFVALDDRTRIANEANADLFVSIHCNAARRRKLEGVETWTLNVASDRYAARLAAFENADADRTVSDLRMILADLATKANASDARELAQSVQSSLVRTLRSRSLPVRDHGTKQALFYVLLGTHMPSILVETGFISNPSEEARLKSARFQEGTAEAIARGVKEFVDSRRQLASVP